MIRLNRIGMVFDITRHGEKSTKIEYAKKSIIVDVPIDVINQQWYNWQMKGEYIQVAFANFTADEREFIMSGITKEEWDKTFKEEER